MAENYRLLAHVGEEWRKVDLSEDTKIQFTLKNLLLSYDDAEVGRSVSFTLPATVNNNAIVEYANNTRLYGGAMRIVVGVQLVYGGGVVNGQLHITECTKDGYKAIMLIGEQVALKDLTGRTLGEILPYNLPTIEGDLDLAYPANWENPQNFAEMEYIAYHSKDEWARIQANVIEEGYPVSYLSGAGTMPTIGLYQLLLRALSAAGIRHNLDVNDAAAYKYRLIAPAVAAAYGVVMVTQEYDSSEQVGELAVTKWHEEVPMTLRTAMLKREREWEGQLIQVDALRVWDLRSPDGVSGDYTYTIKMSEDLPRTRRLGIVSHVDVLGGEYVVPVMDAAATEDYPPDTLSSLAGTEIQITVNSELGTYLRWYDLEDIQEGAQWYKDEDSGKWYINLDYEVHREREYTQELVLMQGSEEDFARISERAMVEGIKLYDLIKMYANLRGWYVDMIGGVLTFADRVTEDTVYIKNVIGESGIKRTVGQWAQRNSMEYSGGKKAARVYEISNVWLDEEKVLYNSAFSAGENSKDVPEENVYIEDKTIERDDEGTVTYKREDFDIAVAEIGDFYWMRAAICTESALITRVCEESTQVKIKVGMTLHDWLRIVYSTRIHYDGGMWVWYESQWGDGVATMTLQKIG